MTCFTFWVKVDILGTVSVTGRKRAAAAEKSCERPDLADMLHKMWGMHSKQEMVLFSPQQCRFGALDVTAKILVLREKRIIRDIHGYK